jgi:hypothetical protein
MKTIKTLWFALFIVCSLALVSGSGGVFAVETGSEIDSAPPAAPAPEEARALSDGPSVRGGTSGTLKTRLRILGGQVETPTGATTEPSAGPAARGLLQSTDVQVNWSGGDAISYTTQSETTIRINPNTGTICAAYNDSQSSYDGLGKTGHSRSTDGGATFVDGGAFPNGPGTGEEAYVDPSLGWRDADGFFYYVSMMQPYGNPLGMWRSSDDCETFSFYSPITGTNGADREMMAIDNNPASRYYGRFYVAWMSAGIWVTHSDGITWTRPVSLSVGGDVHAPWPAVDPVTGDVYVAWRRWHTDHTGFMDIEIKRSTDGGATWDFVNNPLTLATISYHPAATARCGGSALLGDIRHFSAPQIVVDRDSNLHVVYSRDPDGAEVGDVINVYYGRSPDQGLTWEPEVQLNDDATLNDQWFPTLSVGPTGTVVATWYDRRNDPGNIKYDYYMAISLDNGVTWGPNIRVSDVSSSVAPTNPNFDLGITNICYHGDYDQQVQDGAYAYITWSDDRNIQHGHPDPDVWFDKALVTPETIYLPLIRRGTQ